MGVKVALAVLLATLAANFVDAEFDHQAHAKPGGPYYAVDWNGDGGETVTLDATESHSHYFDHGPPPKSGFVVGYHWVSGHTGKTLINTKSSQISGHFFNGITILKLTVTDNMGDKASGWTYIQVRKPHKWENKAPTVKSIEPDSGPLDGGISVTIEGSDFYNNPKVHFNGNLVEFRIISDSEIIATSPKVNKLGPLLVTVTNGFGKSAQKVIYWVKKAAVAPPVFRLTTIKAKGGKGSDDDADFALPEITTIKIGPDGRYYAGSQDGFIYKFSINRQLIVEQWCKSAKVGHMRSVLGIAFHPHEWSTPRAYIATSLLFWKKKKTGADWDNGDVEVWTSVASAECMSFSHTVITGLPVANHDHGVNALEFQNNGDLMIAVGGTTNAGVYTHNDQVGGIPESPLSGAILIAKLSLGTKFDGKIMYNQKKDPGTAKVVSGSVEVYAAGMRNVFGMTRHSNKFIYAMDNGPNSGYGPSAKDCKTVGPQLSFADKLLLIQKGAYYGHPNSNRGRFDHRQCVFRKGDTKGLPPKMFTPPLAVLPSSTNGIIEYTANTFNFQMRGNLLLSKLSWGGSGQLFRVSLFGNGKKMIGSPAPFLKESGLSIVMGAFGAIFMPKLKQKKVVAYVPIDNSHEALRVIFVAPATRAGDRSEPCSDHRKWVLGRREDLLQRQGMFDVYVANTRKHLVPSTSRKAGSIVSVVAKHGGLSSKPSGHSDYEYMAY